MPKMPTEIKSLARSYTNSALSVLKSIMQQPDAPPAARVTAAIALLDRGWGKPDQSKDVTIPHAKANKVSDDELAAIALGSSDGVADETPDPTQLN